MLPEHAALYVDLIQQLGIPLDAMKITLKSLKGSKENVLCNKVRESMAQRLPGITIADVSADQDEEEYYRGVNYKIAATIGGSEYELADGGIVDWTQKLLGNSKERFVISGIGSERLFTVMWSSG